jgi:site-specific DNA-cytosine methylase
MRVLIACEFSGVVRDAFLAKEHDAFSCDLLPALSNPERHFQCDVREVLSLRDPPWDLIIAHPPCTALCVSGNRYYADTPARDEAVDFFRIFLEASAPRVCVENPVGVISTRIRPPDQYIQPYQFGHPESKKTGLWLKGLPKLKSTEILPLPACGYWSNQTPSRQNKLGPSPNRGLLRSITYSGIANAMADQWG